MSGRAEKKAGTKLMLVAGVLSCLAGAIFLADWYVSRQTVWISIGAMFFGIGGMWVAIAASFRKKEARDQAMRET